MTDLQIKDDFSPDLAVKIGSDKAPFARYNKLKRNMCHGISVEVCFTGILGLFLQLKAKFLHYLSVNLGNDLKRSMEHERNTGLAGHRTFKT